MVAGLDAAGASPAASNGIAWIYGSGGIRHVFARDPNADITTYDPDKHMPLHSGGFGADGCDRSRSVRVCEDTAAS